MSVTLPTYDWDFRQVLSSGSTITDSFSQESLTLDGPSATVADGASVTQYEDHIDFGDTTITISPTFTMEMYWKSGSTRVLSGSNNYCYLWRIQKSEYSSSHGFTVRQDSGGNYMVKYPIDETANNVTREIHDVAHNWTANTTYHFVLTFTPTTSRMYVNNVLLSTETLTTPFNNGVTANQGGTLSALMNKSSASWSTLAGDIYYWRFYDSELSASEISTLYENRETINYLAANITLTLPTYDWNLLVEASDGDIVYDNISNNTATYENGLTGTATLGTVNNSNSGRLRIPNSSVSFHLNFSFEVLVRFNSTFNQHQVFFSHSNDGKYGFGLYYGSDTSNELRFFGSLATYSGLFQSDTTGTYTGSALSTDGSTYHHIVCVLDGANDKAYMYQDGTKIWEQISIGLSESDFPITPSTYLAIGKEQQATNINVKTFRVWENHALIGAEINTLYNIRDTANYFNFTNLRINYGDVYLTQTLNKTLANYKTENIPLNDVSFAAFPINKFKETYILGDVDISGDTILRSNTTYFTDISADTFDVSGNLLISDLSANNRLFVGDDVSFNSNVTIQGDLSFGGDISFNGTFTRAQASIGTGSGLLMNTDFSMNATLEFNGATTVKNDLHFNAYSDLSANPVLTDGTLLHNQKMEKLDHRYLLDISRSSPFSTLNYNTLPSNIYDNSTNSGICISGDGKYIRTVNSSDVSANALSYYSEDYGSSFQVDNELSNKLSLFDVSMNSLDDYYTDTIPGATYTNEPVNTTGLWTSGGTTGASFTHSSGTYYISSNSSLGNMSGTMYDVWRVFQVATNSTTAVGHAMNRTGWVSTSGNIRRHGSTSLTAYDAANSATTYNGDYITVTTPYSFQMTEIGFANHWIGNFVNKFMIIGEDSTGTNRVLLSETSHTSSNVATYVAYPVTTTYVVNKFYFHITEINSANSFTGIRKLRWSGIQPATLNQEFRPKFGSDKIFMSYNGQHQLIPKGISNKPTYDDFLYVSNNFGKNWNLRKNNTISTTTYTYTVTANGSSNYILNGGGFSSEAQPAVSIYLNESTEFTIDSTTNGNHPFKIGTSENGDEITDSRITSVTSGSNQVVTFKPTTSGTFYYYCSAHSGMGSSINVIEPAGRFSLDASGSTWFWNTGAVSSDGKHMYVSGKTGLWKSQDFGTSWYQASSDSSFNYMSISADGKQVYGVNERKVYGSSDYGNTFSTLYTDSYTSDLSYAGISTSGNGKYITIADVSGFNIYMSSNYGNSFDIKPLETFVNNNINCGMSHSGKIVLNSNYISYNYGNNFHYIPHLISNQLTNNDTFYSKANMEYLLDPSNNLMLSIPYKSAQFQDIYSVGSIKVGSTTYSSDYRIKENVEELGEEDTVNELRPVKYYNTNLESNDYGLIAHELQEKYPFLVSGEKDGPEPQSINYNGLISLIVHEVKNLKKESLELKKEYLELQEMKK
jgi:hypothetical protein